MKIKLLFLRYLMCLYPIYLIYNTNEIGYIPVQIEKHGYGNCPDKTDLDLWKMYNGFWIKFDTKLQNKKLVNIVYDNNFGDADISLNNTIDKYYICYSINLNKCLEPCPPVL